MEHDATNEYGYMEAGGGGGGEDKRMVMKEEDGLQSQTGKMNAKMTKPLNEQIDEESIFI